MSIELVQRLQTRFPKDVLGSHHYQGQATAILRREGLLAIARFLRDDPSASCDMLMDVTCVDYLKFGKSQRSSPTLATPSPLPYYMQPKSMTQRWERLPAALSTNAADAAQAGLVPSEDFRFEVVYHLYSTTRNHRLRLKVPLTLADPVVDSLTGVWASANWFEREVWDMFGVQFTGHPNLKRLLMYEAFTGHPLRKDYPVYKRQPLIGPVT